MDTVDLAELRALLKRQKDFWMACGAPGAMGVGNEGFYYNYIHPLQAKLDRRFANTLMERKKNCIPLLLCISPKAIAPRKQYELLGFHRNRNFQSYIKHVFKIADIDDEAIGEDVYLLLNVDVASLSDITWGDAFGKFANAQKTPLLNFSEGLMAATALGRGMVSFAPRNQVAMLRSTYMATDVPYFDFGVAGMVVLNFVDWQSFKSGTRAAAFYEYAMTNT